MLRIVEHHSVGSVRIASREHVARLVTVMWLALVLSTGLGCSSGTHEGAAIRALSDTGPRQPAQVTPRLAVDRLAYDLGEIKPNTASIAVFHLTNDGGSPLQITDVKKCCGAVIKLEKKKLAPGETGVLTVEYRVAQGVGTIAKKIRIVSNDPTNPLTELTVTAEMVQTLAWTPARFSLSSHESNVKCPEISIKSLDGTVFSVKGVVATGQIITANFDPNQRAAQLTLKPEVDMAKLNASATSTGSLAISLDHPDYKTIKVPFDVVPPVQATPAQILVFDAREGDSIAKVVGVQDNQADPNIGSPVLIEAVTAMNGSRVELRTVTPKKAGCELNLVIWPAKGKGNEAFAKDQLVVKLKDGREVTVPLRVFFQSPTVSSTVAPSSKS